MGKSLSQLKRNRQNRKRYLANKAVRSEVKTRSRQAVDAARTGDADRAHELLRAAQKRIDSAVSKGVLHRNAAARRKSQLAKRVRTLLEG